MINMPFPSSPGPIGVFDSGYGGLTILHGIRQLLPQYDYMYLGDNARAPYGSRSFEVVYQFTRQAVLKLFSMGCHLVILGCNTASAKALRSIQQRDLPMLDPDRRVLGVIRPTAEEVGNLTKTRHVGILATEGTIKSNSYKIEIQKLFPDVEVTGVACPLWAAIVEAGEADSPGADYFVKKRIDQLMRKDSLIDTVTRLHSLPTAYEFGGEERARRCAHNGARHLRSRLLSRLSQSPSRDGTETDERRNMPLFHNRKRRTLPRNSTHIPA